MAIASVLEDLAEKRARAFALRMVEEMLGRLHFENASRLHEHDPVRDLARWSGEERLALVRIFRAKVAKEETGYLSLLRRHQGLKRAMLKLGSAS